MASSLSRRETARVLAGSFLGGEWELEAMAKRAGRALGRRVWHRRVAERTLRAYRHPPRDRPRELADFVFTLLDDVRLPPQLLREPVFHTEMAPGRWPVPRIDTLGDLADRLELDPGQLDWLADVRGLERTSTGKLRNYTYVRVPRRSGPPRVLERPKARLKEIQRWILRELLAWIPAHDAAHGFVKGRSAHTHAALHVGRKVVVRLDLEDFFAAVSAARVYGIFRTAGYPEAVAHTLTGLCTNAVPADESVPEHFRLARRLATPHLPQGAPTSPALANLAAHALDRRLAGLAREIGATYSRYADDLVLSADHHLRTPHAAVTEIARDEGFNVNRGKTRTMGRGSRQVVTGIVVNAHPNVPRAEYDRLKAILHQGAEGVDPAQLLGRISWVEAINPARGAKLRALWTALGNR